MTGFWEHKLLSARLSGLGYSIDNLRLAGKAPGHSGGPGSPGSPTGGRAGGPRRMSDSYCEVVLPFRTNSHLLEDYTSIYGGVRVGKLLEDLDVLAASIAYLHCDDLDLTIVTAAVDRIDILVPIDAVISDIRMKGSVTYVGRSSIEVTISVECNQQGEEVWDLAALAKFILVARSAEGTAAVEVNRLALQGPREEEIFAAGQERHRYRLRRDAESLFRLPPTSEESAMVHQLCMHQTVSTPTAYQQRLVPAKATKIDALRICHPQERNIHNYIFGGYLCREAFELAFGNALVFFGGVRPNVNAIDEISFVHPVPIGSLLNFGSQIVYSQVVDGHNYVAVEVVADVLNPSLNERLTTNTFRFTMSCPVKPGDQVPCVLPETYMEAMKYLEGKRRMTYDFSNQVNEASCKSVPPHFDPVLDTPK
jgi:acyl-coenzyme A thioesterase 9